MYKRVCVRTHCTGLPPTLSLVRALKPLNSKSAQDEAESGICLQEQPRCRLTNIYAHTHTHSYLTCGAVHPDNKVNVKMEKQAHRQKQIH